MAFVDLLDHEVYIERRLGTGTEDEYGQAVTTLDTSHRFAAAIQQNSAHEVLLASQAGTPIGDYIIFCLPRVILENEAIIHDTNICPKAADVDLPTQRFEVNSVKNAAGRGHHLELDATLTGSPGGVEGS
jgi:hypothetical protein